MQLLWCFSICLFLLETSFAVEEVVLVSTGNGPLRGEKRGNYFAFEGIPYAKAPVGTLRLAPSVLNDERWTEPKNVTKPGPVCAQWSHFVTGDDKFVGEEDCLFLNIYTTSLGEQSEPLSTIFFIHGGAFMFGNGDFYKPDNLLTKPAILVTFNYRLGPLGFLSTEDDVIPGNFGLKDQVTALKWIRRNIASFGGHKRNITMVGYSAGSASVQLHYLSPLTRGLFKNGIGHSGSVLNPWVLMENAVDKAKSIAERVGCSTASSDEMLKCLRKQPAADIVRAVRPMFTFLYNPFSPLGVVIEKHSARNPEPFLMQHPYKLMKEGNFYRVPLILSVCEAEGLYPGAEFASKQEYLDEINQNWNRVVPSILDFQNSMRDHELDRDKISDLIRERYMGKAKLTFDNFKDFNRAISNRLYFAGVVTSAKLMDAYIPVYLYVNHYKTKYSVGEYLLGTTSTQKYGVSHGEDVLLVLKNPLRDTIPYTAEELRVASLFAQMYERFSHDHSAVFGEAQIPRIGVQNVVHYLQVNYPESKERSEEQLDDEKFWNKLNFRDALCGYLSSVKTEL